MDPMNEHDHNIHMVQPIFEYILIDNQCAAPGHQKRTSEIDLAKLIEFGEGEIHGLFEYQNFSAVYGDRTDAVSYMDHPISEELYRRMRPALRLATILLDRAKPYCMTLLFGPEIKLTNPMDRNRYTLAPVSSKPNPDLERRYEAIMRKVQEKARICSNLVPNTPGCCKAGRGDYGRAIINYLPFLGDIESRLVYRIAIMADLWKAFSDAEWNLKDVEQRLYQWLFLAVLLVHEVMHLLILERQSPLIIRELHNEIWKSGNIWYTSFQEPYFEALQDSEVGLTWEYLQFGGLIEPIFSLKHYPIGSIYKPLSTDLCKQEFVHTFTHSTISLANTIDNHVLGIALDTIVMLFDDNRWTGSELIPMYLYPDKLYHGYRKTDPIVTLINNLCGHGPASTDVRRLRSQDTRGGRIPATSYKSTDGLSRNKILENNRSFMRQRVYDMTDFSQDMKTFIPDKNRISTLELKFIAELKSHTQLDLTSLRTSTWSWLDAEHDFWEFHERPRTSVKPSEQAGSDSNSQSEDNNSTSVMGEELDLDTGSDVQHDIDTDMRDVEDVEEDVSEV